MMSIAEGEGLDSRSGHQDTTRGYHYHIPTPTIGCFSGEPTGEARATDPGC